jgi:prepilin-type N-terminal cleavage/methylation domain-containing protein
MKSKKAFTFLELMTVILIIAVLAAIAVPNFLEAQIRSKNAEVLARERLVAAALESYYVDYKAYPQNIALVDFRLTKRVEEYTGDINNLGMGIESMALPREYFDPTVQPVERRTDVTVGEWITGKKLPEGAPLVREVHVCSRCGFYNPAGTNECHVCIWNLDTDVKTEVYSYSPDGSVLNVLTTPIAYLPLGVNEDLYEKRGHETVPPPWSESDPSTFCYLNFTQVKPDGLDIPGVHGKARYAIISVGPDREFDFVNSHPEPDYAIYDPTNGTISDGDVITWRN